MSERDIKVSTLMATYNHERFVGEAIRGVLMQKSTFPFELIIGEDCSTDQTRQIVLDYQKRFPHIVRVVTSEQNVGGYENTRRLLQASRGKYIAFCEGDDFWHRDDKLQMQVELLENHRECGLVCSEYDVRNVTTGETIRDYVNYRGCHVPTSRSIEDFIANRSGLDNKPIGCSIRTCTMVGRKDLIMQIRKADPHLYQTDTFRMRDTPLCAEINMLSTILFIRESLATYNILPESASRSRDASKRLRFFINGCEMWLYLCDKYKVSAEVRQMHEMRRLHAMLCLAFEERDVVKADAVKAEKGLRDLKEMLLYLGARHPSIHGMYAVARQVKEMLFKKADQWA